MKPVFSDFELQYYGILFSKAILQRNNLSVIAKIKGEIQKTQKKY
jgi:hypothetical protein